MANFVACTLDVLRSTLMKSAYNNHVSVGMKRDLTKTDGDSLQGDYMHLTKMSYVYED